MLAESDACRREVPVHAPWSVPPRSAEREGPPRPRFAACKAAADILLSLVLLALTTPFVLFAVVLVRLTSRGPAFYSQTRLGLNGKPFTMYKLRTMIHDCERRSGVRWSGPGDNRITPVGQLLRRTHLDEVPQLWNVLKGDMSLIGPRPERPEFAPQLERLIPCYRQRLRVRPGLTGLAQVQLPADTNLDSVRHKLACDLYYVQHYGVRMDLQIFLATIVYMLGLPFAVSRFLFNVPGGAPVERAYLRLVAQSVSYHRVQPPVDAVV
jgi:lipopolysaccharide/colanic/teichoic acid biosynthesis glycosyltransferase